jgi:hypothetical protein
MAIFIRLLFVSLLLGSLLGCGRATDMSGNSNSSSTSVNTAIVSEFNNNVNFRIEPYNTFNDQGEVTVKIVPNNFYSDYRVSIKVKRIKGMGEVAYSFKNIYTGKTFYKDNCVTTHAQFSDLISVSAFTFYPTVKGDAFSVEIMLSDASTPQILSKTMTFVAE